ncbi:MAG: hypothetical protein JST12_01180 [Armatimonadetes bacterium]|nr:hypothetical protein [Armatimonadota bacterium]
MSERRFSEAELRQILKSAATAQAESLGGPIASQDFGLDDVRRIAAEVGIDSKYVEAAARQHVPISSSPKKFNLKATVPIQVFERRCPTLMSAEAWQESIGEMRREFGDIGTTSSSGSTVYWSSRSPGRAVRLEAVPVEDGTCLGLVIEHEMETQTKLDHAYQSFIIQASSLALIFLLVGIVLNVRRGETLELQLALALLLLMLVTVLVSNFLVRRKTAENASLADSVLNKIVEKLKGSHLQAETDFDRSVLDHDQLKAVNDDLSSSRVE